MRKLARDDLDGFSFRIVVPAWAAAAAAGFVGDDRGDAIVERAGQERGLAEPRVADDREAFPVDMRVGHEVVDAAVDAPGPPHDGARAVAGALVPHLGHGGAHAFVHVGAVGLDVAAVKCGDGVAALDGGGERPAVPAFRLLPAAGFGGLIIHDAGEAAGIQAVGTRMRASSSRRWLPPKLGPTKQAAR